MTVQWPETEEGRRELGNQMAVCHAAMVRRSIEALSCPSWQKERLWEAVMEAAKQDAARDSNIKKAAN